MFEINFVDYNGNIIQTEDTNMECYYTRIPLVEQNKIQGKVNIHHGLASIDANDLIDPNDKIWVFGIIEVG